MNLLLVIVDCLRYDRVCKMPFLSSYGTHFTNYRSVSHCTDPSVTCMLSGRHPDDLKLYSMMFEHKNYSIPADVEMLPQFALRHGYDTGFVTNVGRWYRRGVKNFVDCRMWPGERIFGAGTNLASSMKEPWLLIVHTDDCHTHYTGGSYDKACVAVDEYLKKMLQSVDATVIVTSDHGEGLGQRGIKQHGYGLWPFLTHVPLVCNFDGDTGALLDNESVYDLMVRVILGWIPELTEKDHVFQAGDTPPNVRHRGVVFPDGAQFVREVRGNKVTDKILIGEGHTVSEAEQLLSDHCLKYGINYEGEAIDPAIEERLRSLGYFE